MEIKTAQQNKKLSEELKGLPAQLRLTMLKEERLIFPNHRMWHPAPYMHECMRVWIPTQHNFRPNICQNLSCIYPVSNFNNWFLIPTINIDSKGKLMSYSKECNK